MKPEQAAAFKEHGYVYLKGALKKEVTQLVKAHVLSELKRLKIWSAGRTLSDRLKGLPAFQQIGRLGQLIKYPGLKDRLISPDIVSMMRELAGAGLVPEPEAQLLLSLPRQGEWTLAGLNWHRDISQAQLTRIPGVLAFVLIDDLVPKGGATLALAGSHELKGQRQITSKTGAGPSGTTMLVGDQELPVLEMAGKTGDVYLMDMRVIHTPSINSSKNVRMMATIRYFKEWNI